MGLKGLSETLLDLQKMEREEKRYDKDVELRLLSYELDVQKEALGAEYTEESRELQNLQNQYNTLIQSYEESTGELHDLTKFDDPSNALVVLDSITSPILEPIENKIRNVRSNQTKLTKAIKDVNLRLNEINIVKDFYSGETVDFTGGDDSQYYDPEDFDIKNLKIQLGVDPDADFPEEMDYLNRIITKGTAGIAYTSEGLNKEIAQAGSAKINLAVDEYTSRNIDDPSTYTQEFIDDITRGVTYMLDASVLSNVSTNFAPSLDLAKNYAYISTAYYAGEGDFEEADVISAQEDLDAEKILVGSRFTQGLLNNKGEPFSDEFNLKLGGNLLAAMLAYNQSFENPPEKRNILPMIDVIEEIDMMNHQHIRNIYGYTDGKGVFHPPKYKKASPDWNDAVDLYENFKNNVTELLNWDWDDMQANLNTVIKAGDHLQESGTGQLEEIINERLLQLEDTDISPSSDNKINEGGMPVGEGDIKTFDYESAFTEFSKGHEDESDILESIQNIEHLYDLSTGDDGVNNQFDIDGDGLPDDPLKVFEHYWGPPEKDPYKTKEEINIILQEQGTNPWNWNYLRNNIDETNELFSGVGTTFGDTQNTIDLISAIDPFEYYEMGRGEQLETLYKMANITLSTGDSKIKGLIDNLIFVNGIEQGLIPHGVVNQISGLYMPGYDDMKTRNPDDKKTRYYYNPETEMIYDYDGELVRKVTTNNEKWYFANFDNSVSNQKNTQIQKLYDSPSTQDDVLMNYLLEDGNIDSEKAAADILNWDIDSGVKSSMYNSLWSDRIYTMEYERMLRDAGIHMLSLSGKNVRYLSETVGTTTPFHHLGGGYLGYGATMSPYHGRFTNVLIRYYNEAIDADNDITLKYFHKFNDDSFERMAENIDVVDLFMNEYPGQYKKALEIALKRAKQTQLSYIAAVLDPSVESWSYNWYGENGTLTETWELETISNARYLDVIRTLNLMHK